jgi:conjugal transfer pilus assembly protein TraV
VISIKTFAKTASAAAMCLSVLAGCSFSGLGGTTRLSCPMPEGTACKSISQTYADSRRALDVKAPPVPAIAQTRIPMLALPTYRARLVEAPIIADIQSAATDAAHETSAVAAAVSTKPVPTVSSAAQFTAAPTVAPRAATLTNALPLRSAPRVMRVWIAPYEDSDGDLNDQKFIYVQIDAGGWNVEHQRELATRSFAPLKPPTATTPSPDKADAAKGLVSTSGQVK